MSRSFRLGLFLLTTMAILSVCVFLVGRQALKFELSSPERIR
jgi:hypothetical protein